MQSHAFLDILTTECQNIKQRPPKKSTPKMYGQEALPKSINSLSVVKFVNTVMNHRNILSVVFYRYICFFIFNCWLKIDLPVGHEINVHFHRHPPAWDGRHLPNPASLNMLTTRCLFSLHRTHPLHQCISCSFWFCPCTQLLQGEHTPGVSITASKSWPCLLSGLQKILSENTVAAVLHLLSHSPAIFAAYGDSPP